MRSEIRLKSRKTTLILLFIALIFWFAVLSNISFTYFQPDTFYYIRKLPLQYWLGSIILSVLIYAVSAKKIIFHKFECIFLLFILILYYYGISVFSYPIIKYFDALYFTVIIQQFMDPILFLNASNSISYLHEFEGTTILFSIITLFVNEKIIIIAKYYPLFFISMILMILIAISKSLLIKSWATTPIAFLSFLWVQIDHICPQGHVFLLSSVLLLLMCKSLTSSKVMNLKVLMLIVWISIVISHALTPIIIIICYISTIMLYAIYSLIYYHSNKISNPFVNFSGYRVTSLICSLTLPLIIFLSYIFYTSDFILSRIFLTIINILKNINNEELFAITDRHITQSDIPSDSYLILYYIRMIIILLVVVLGLINIIIIFNNKNNSLPYESKYLVCSLFISLFSFGSMFVIVGYNTYGPSRIFMFLLIPFSLLCSIIIEMSFLKTHKYKKFFIIYRKFLILIIIMALVIIPITKYGGDPYEFISESEYQGSLFILEHPSLRPFSNYIYYTITTRELNFEKLKTPGNLEYLKFFNNKFNSIYNSGQCVIFRVI